MDITKKIILQKLLNVQSRILEIDDKAKLEDIFNKLTIIFPEAEIVNSNKVEEEITEKMVMTSNEGILEASDSSIANSDEIQYKIQDEVVEIKEVNDKESIENFGVTQGNNEVENEILEESEQISGGKVFNYPEEILKEKEEAGKTIIEENKNELESHERPKEVKVNASKDIFKVFTINDKFLYRRELFGNSDAQYKEALELISRMDSFEDVKDYFLNDLGWNPNDENAKGFMETLEKKYFN